MSAPDEVPSPDLVADVDAVFLGWWPDDLMRLVRAPFRHGVLVAYAHRESGRFLPHD